MHRTNWDFNVWNWMINVSFSSSFWFSWIHLSFVVLFSHCLCWHVYKSHNKTNVLMNCCWIKNQLEKKSVNVFLLRWLLNRWILKIYRHNTQLSVYVIYTYVCIAKKHPMHQSDVSLLLALYGKSNKQMHSFHTTDT